MANLLLSPPLSTYCPTVQPDLQLPAENRPPFPRSIQLQKQKQREIAAQMQKMIFSSPVSLFVVVLSLVVLVSSEEDAAVASKDKEIETLKKNIAQLESLLANQKEQLAKLGGDMGNAPQAEGNGAEQRSVRGSSEEKKRASACGDRQCHLI